MVWSAVSIFIFFCVSGLKCPEKKAQNTEANIEAMGQTVVIEQEDAEPGHDSENIGVLTGNMKVFKFRILKNVQKNYMACSVNVR